MSLQKKLIDDILSSYDIISENKKLVFEVVDVYPNINFVDRLVGNSTPSKDNISTTLLQDVQKAAKAAGLVVDVTTAVSGHRPSKRHQSGQAVDIARINGKVVSTSNRADADKLVNALVSMGYLKNSENSNDKAVLTFGFEGHDDHVHISNTGGASTQEPTNTTTTNTTQTSTETPDATSTDSETQTTPTKKSSRDFAKQVGSTILNAIGINESFKPGAFGVNTKIRSGKLIIPRNSNPKIKSPVSGNIVTSISNSSCLNQLTIEFSDGYLEYCGITSISEKVKDRVGVGTVLGTSTSNVTVSYYTNSKRKEPIVFDTEEKTKQPEKTDSDKNKERDDNSDLAGKSGYSQLLIKGYRNLKKAFDVKTDKKLDENINRIKGLL